ncbi:hypothetical protein PABG_07186 [Paracoccidioides brasiliensis Pb03]|uniref:Mitochondrial genome maintenance protein Mgr2 n=2 Tax=Paracoccidioides brasiliensis TaxID=121759 RepID=C1GD13_PARBD|nr:uncharacterized protein PADG_05149 [Paracoccidioides brasiliensis Pb18]EEH17099.2 hypothetical protein PABG_07186 [Paracoccidioides brasiliensis Pb03]EEH49070.2 hypothetical protein PADG_05149 [Paracoccidioides brasiliensis Pb18]ODH34360.1 hypothetical protein ACO22_03106 [Paracoccidioides brasiliensis]ODH46231.1 hypothetical protein GX48_07699 [Paracoccidioides brasiliensis]
MPPVIPASGGGGMHGPSAFDKFKMGAMMGGSVGLIMGFIMGTVAIFQYGAGPNGVMRTLGKYMIGSGATFGKRYPNRRTPQLQPGVGKSSRGPNDDSPAISSPPTARLRCQLAHVS